MSLAATARCAAASVAASTDAPWTKNSGSETTPADGRPSSATTVRKAGQPRAAEGVGYCAVELGAEAAQRTEEPSTAKGINLMEDHQPHNPSLSECSLKLACTTPAFAAPSGRIELADGGWRELGRSLHDLLHYGRQNGRLAVKLLGLGLKLLGAIEEFGQLGDVEGPTLRDDRFHDFGR